jgi:hypothetical protein
VTRKTGRPPLDPTGAPSVTVSVRLTARQFDDLYARAQRDRQRLAEILRRAAGEFCNRNSPRAADLR